MWRSWHGILLALVLALAGCGGPAPIAEPNIQTQAEQAPVADSAELGALPEAVAVSTVEELRTRDDVVLLDVREDWEFAEGHVPNAMHMPLSQIPQRMSEIPQDKTVIAICRSGNRSGQATDYLRQQGFDNVHNMEGGMLSWQQAGYEVAQ